MRTILRGLMVMCGLLAVASEANAQLFPLFPQVRANIQARRDARNQTPIATQSGVVQTTPNGYAVGQSPGEGYCPPAYCPPFDPNNPNQLVPLAPHLDVSEQRPLPKISDVPLDVTDPVRPKA